jgi:hypothetical protein
MYHPIEADEKIRLLDGTCRINSWGQVAVDRLRLGSRSRENGTASTWKQRVQQREQLQSFDVRRSPPVPGEGERARDPRTTPDPVARNSVRGHGQRQSTPRLRREAAAVDHEAPVRVQRAEGDAVQPTTHPRTVK